MSPRFLILSIALLFPTILLAEATDTIKIGWSGPLTGNSAVLGIDSVEAARIAVDEANAAGGVNGKKLELVAEDDQYDTAKAVTAYSRLVNAGAAAILASSYGGVFATAERAVKDHVVVIDPLDCNNDIAALSENTFCIATESESIGRIISADIIKKKLDPIAVIYDEKNPFMDLVYKVLRIEKGRSPLSYYAGVDQNSADFKTILLHAKQKGARAYVFLGHDPMGQAMREARSIGIKDQFYTLGTITSPGYQKLAGDAANGALVAYWEAPRGPSLESFLKRFQEKVGRPPILELATIPTYDAARILITSLPSMKGSPGVEGIKKSLYALKDFEGLSGKLSMDPDGAVRTIREAIYRYNGGKLVLESVK